VTTGIFVAVLILAGVMAGIFVAAVVITRRVGTGAERRADVLRAEVAGSGEVWEIPLTGAVYQGGGPAARSKGHGVLGLTDRRVVFLPIVGDQLTVPRVRIAGARLEERRRDAASDHRHRLLLTLDDGTDVAFLVDDPSVWLRELPTLGSSGGRRDLKD
jgi:hypothetical protein